MGEFKEVDANRVDNVILAVDDDLTMEVAQIWGARAKQDTLAGYFTHECEDLSLCDIEPIELVPTWRDFISGSEKVSEIHYRKVLHQNGPPKEIIR
jgi:hypothetical protein